MQYGAMRCGSMRLVGLLIHGLGFNPSPETCPRIKALGFPAPAVIHRWGDAPAVNHRWGDAPTVNHNLGVGRGGVVGDRTVCRGTGCRVRV